MREKEAEPAIPDLQIDQRLKTPLGTIVRDKNDLKQTGWAVLYPPGLDDRIRQNLQPLIQHRQAQVNHDKLFKVFDGETGYQPGDTAESWLRARGVTPNIVNPSLGVPYYVLIVGSPEQIPFRFQYALDLFWAVGRLWFDDPDDFRAYAESVIRYETMPEVSIRRQVGLFAPRHEFDKATQLFADDVAEPFAGGNPDLFLNQVEGVQVRPFIEEAATRQSLFNLLNGSVDMGQPALLFSGGHGMYFPSDDHKQAVSTGALLCQDWSGLGHVAREDYFEASDVPKNAKIHGLIHFMFACYGGGWPQFDTFRNFKDPEKQISPRPMIAKLPQALLAHRDGGALAVLAHIDRAWAYSFRAADLAQTQGFSSVLINLMSGDRIGEACDAFNMLQASTQQELNQFSPQSREGSASERVPTRQPMGCHERCAKLRRARRSCGASAHRRHGSRGQVSRHCVQRPIGACPGKETMLEFEGLVRTAGQTLKAPVPKYCRRGEGPF